MQLAFEVPQGRYYISAYESGRVQVNQQWLTSNIIIAADYLLDLWPIANFPVLTAVEISPILTLKPEVVLVGTGAKLQLLAPALLSLFYQQQIGVEVMTTAAACRTYNILSAEGRKVVAALVVE